MKNIEKLKYCVVSHYKEDDSVAFEIKAMECDSKPENINDVENGLFTNWFDTFEDAMEYAQGTLTPDDTLTINAN